MKGIITSLISCVIFFAAFGISVGIMGYKESVNNLTYFDTPSYSDNVADILYGNTNDSGQWKIDHTFDSIKINSWGLHTQVVGTDRDDIFISLSNRERKSVSLYVYCEKDGGENGTLNIQVNPMYRQWFTNFSFDIANWFKDFLTGNASDVVLRIEVPEKIYAELELDQGSGSVLIEEVYAKYNRMNIGSGSFTHSRRKAGNTAAEYTLTLGSGSAYVDCMDTEKYELNIGSGSFNVNRLTGGGVVDMGSGRGQISFEKYNGECNVDIGSGNITVMLPSGADAKVNCDIGSGSVEVSANGVYAHVGSGNDDAPVVIGKGTHNFNIDMGSGHIGIYEGTNNSEYANSAIGEAVMSSYDEETTAGVFEITYVTEEE